MMARDACRRAASRALTGQSRVVLRGEAPTAAELERRYEAVDDLGIYLHIPFCRQICAYCPYNKTLYSPELARRYAGAVSEEIAFYSRIVGRRPVTSLYIGGGTPTTMLDDGLDAILERLHDGFDVRCDVHMESHPNDLTAGNLAAISALGVRHLSTGVESLQDRHLKFLGRPYTAEQAKEAVRRAVDHGFACVNADVMFDLPGQECREVEEAGHELLELGVDQVAAYPLFRFPYTPLGRGRHSDSVGVRTVFRRRRMLHGLERLFYAAGFERTSVWAFTRSGVPRYCSVTVPRYLGLGVSGGTYLDDLFYLNTFDVREYIEAVASTGTAIALSVDLTRRMQMAGWLYWRIYETRIARREFQRRFGEAFDEVYGKYLGPLGRMGFLGDDGENIVLTDRGSYWLHALEDLFSIEYVGRLWGASVQEPWPEEAVL